MQVRCAPSVKFGNLVLPGNEIEKYFGLVIGRAEKISKIYAGISSPFTKIFARVMDLPFGSAGTHDYP